MQSEYRKSDRKPTVEVYDNEKAILNLIAKTIESLPKGSEILTWDAPLAANYLQVMSEEMFEILSNSKIKKGVQTRSLIPHGQENYLANKQINSAIKVRIAPPGINFDSSTWLFNDSVVLFSGAYTFATCITNKNMKNGFVSFFEYVWQRAQPLAK